MKLCRFNYFLKEDEKIIFYGECRLKSITAFDILDKEGMLLASDKRLVFCKIIGDHPHLIDSFDYKYISSCDIKGDGEDKYLYFKYNGDPVKIMGVDSSQFDKIMKLIYLDCESYKITF